MHAERQTWVKWEKSHGGAQLSLTQYVLILQNLRGDSYTRSFLAPILPALLPWGKRKVLHFPENRFRAGQKRRLGQLTVTGGS